MNPQGARAAIVRKIKNQSLEKVFSKLEKDRHKAPAGSSVIDSNIEAAFGKLVMLYSCVSWLV